MMTKIKLETGEYVIESTVKMYGLAQYFIIRFILVPISSVITIFTGYWLWKAISNSQKPNAILHNIPVYNIISKVSVPIAILAMLVLIYFFINTFTEKVILTNKAILRQNVFSIDRIYFVDITTVIVKYEQFNFNHKSSAGSFFFGLLLGTNWQINIDVANNRYMIIKNMSKKHANELKAKLDEVCSQSLIVI